jgi:hypothetical protein
MAANGHRQSPILYEPKRNNRFTIDFPTELGIETWKVQTSGRPNISINETEIPFLNTSQWVAGRYVFEPLSVHLLHKNFGTG